ncbi:MAG: AbiEi antitoxin N-terminal domain-containing protein [Acidiferrobacterales bacterium]
MLAEHGVSPQLASCLARRGWLRHLSRGLYLLVGDQPGRDGCLIYFARHIPGFHQAFAFGSGEDRTAGQAEHCGAFW